MAEAGTDPILTPAPPAAAAIEQCLRSWFDGGAARTCAIGLAPSGLHPIEAAQVARATPARRAEFAAGRSCARAALSVLGVPPGPIGAGAQRQPLWPAGVRGSISHDRGIAAAALLRAPAGMNCGIDLIALDHAWPADATPLLLAPGEALPAAAGPDRAALLLFSIKESAVKALSPLLDRKIDFAELRAAVGGGTFEIRHPAGKLRGRWADAAGFLVSAAFTEQPILTTDQPTQP